MKKFVSIKMGVIIASFLLMSLFTQTGFAQDNLSLTGVVKSIDKNNGTINLDISSEGCRGLRAFKMPDDSKDDLDASLIGKRLQFMIDGSKCERGRIYNIVFKEQP